MKLNLQSPSSWEDFENLCFQLWKSIWGDPTAHRYGRQGQQQNGVDIYGRGPFDTLYTGIQCKGKNKNYGKKLTKNEIDAECEKAKLFEPSLKAFIMATTSPRDNKVQDHCINLNVKNAYRFEVDTWSWDDIEDEIQCRPELMKVFYPAIKEVDLLNEITLSRFVSINKIEAFFSRPGILNFDRPILKKHIYDLAYELAMNAFYHGNASQFNIQVEGSKITFKDNGKPFNPINLLSNNQLTGGQIAMNYAKKHFRFSYSYKNNENVLEICCNNKCSEYELSSKSEAYKLVIYTNDIYYRDQMSRYVSEQLNRIPRNTQKIVIDIISTYGLGPSLIIALFEELKKSLKNYQSVLIYLPEEIYFEEELGDLINSTRIRFKIKEWED